MEGILREIQELSQVDFKNSWGKLRELSVKAISLMSAEDVYKRDREALESVVWVLDNTEVEDSETWLYNVFRSKRLHAVEAIQNYMKRLVSSYKYEY